MYNVTLTLEADGKAPMYEQLYRYFVGEISGGRLKKGEKLPSKRALCVHLGVSRSTVETAYGILVSEGYVAARPKSGYYVEDYVPALEAASAPAHRVESPAERTVSAPEIDFSTAAVDTSLFPYSSWAKLNKEVVYSCPELLQRGDRQGEKSLRAALAEFLGEYRGVKCSPGQVVIGAGMEYLTDLLLQLFPKDTLLALEDPCYSAIYHTILNNGREPKLIPLDGDGIDVEMLERSGASVAYVTPSHQFPMGVTMPAGRRAQLLRWASAGSGRYIIEDDYDSEFRHFSRPIPAMQGLDGGGRVIYVGTFSRSIAPSVRIAYMVLPEELMGRYREMFAFASSTVSRFEQEVMARFIAGGAYSRYLRKTGNLYRQRCRELCAALCEIPGISVSGNGGGIHFLVSSDALSEDALFFSAARAGIKTQRLSGYCRHCEPRPSTLVLGYGGVDSGRIQKAARLLAPLWAAE